MTSITICLGSAIVHYGKQNDSKPQLPDAHIQPPNPPLYIRSSSPQGYGHACIHLAQRRVVRRHPRQCGAGDRPVRSPISRPPIIRDPSAAPGTVLLASEPSPSASHQAFRPQASARDAGVGRAYPSAGPELSTGHESTCLYHQRGPHGA